MRRPVLPLGAQVVLAAAVAPVLAALVAIAVVPVAVSVALGDRAEPGVVEQAGAAATTAVLVVLAVATLAAFGSSAALARSIRRLLERMRLATEAIASGAGEVRIGARRRDELGELAASIDGVADRLAAMEAGRRELLAAVSHELRTPLTVIRGHLFTLGRRVDDERSRARVATLEAEVDRMAELVGDLLDAASLHAGGMRVDARTCDAAEVARAAADRFAPAARDAGCTVRLRAAGSPWCHADASRLDQVLANLLANAIRHARPGTAVEIDVLGGELPRIDVRNVGDPIPDRLREVLFEPFHRGAGAGRGRLGLGLAIARDLASAMGGGLRLLDGGAATCFRVELAPAEPPACRGSDRDQGPGLPAVVAAAARRRGVACAVPASAEGTR